ncbi:tRNA1(Val) (adenine(37)-N6)-methyltransferase [Desulfonauticus submarinus]
MDLIEFPKILKQPKTQQGFRFAIDSLLLSCFAKPKKKWKILDLGCGCGVIGLGTLLLNPNLNLKVFGLEKEIFMGILAYKNASLLNLNDHYKIIIGNIKDTKKLFKVNDFFDQIILNPPYRPIGKGKLSPVSAKNKAKFEYETSLKDFIKGCKILLKNKGELVLSYLSENISYLITTLNCYNFVIKEMLFIHPRSNQNAKIVLIKAIKNGNPETKILPPLILYQKNKNNIFTPQVKSFCPFLK